MGLKSKTFILSFLSQIIPCRQTPTFMLVCCTATRVSAAHDARHGAGRLLADQHDGTIHLAVHHDDLPELRHLHCRAPEEHARFRINRLYMTTLMRPGAVLIQRYLEPEQAPQPFLRVHRPYTAHRQAGGTVHYLIRQHWRRLRSTF